MQGIGIYRATQCHVKAGEMSLPLHRCGRQRAVEQEENNLPASPLLIAELLLLQPKPGSPVPLQLGMEQAASLAAVLGAVSKGKMWFPCSDPTPCPEVRYVLRSCRMKMWCGICPAITSLPCTLDYQRKRCCITGAQCTAPAPRVNALGREGGGATQNSLGMHTSTELLGAVFWGACSKALRKLPNTHGLSNQKPFPPTQLPSQFLGISVQGKEEAQMQRSSAKPF